MEKKEIKEIMSGIQMVLKANANDITATGLIRIVNTTNDPKLFLSALEALTNKAIKNASKPMKLPTPTKIIRTKPKFVPPKKKPVKKAQIVDHKKAQIVAPGGVSLVAPGVIETLGLNHVFKGFKQKFNLGLKY